ncbi:MAG: VWA domain-containing protein [Deltaproteobacteria bacterium]|nr:VWA domain-containing protein [Deltaproteobacteria bacterium]
MQIHSPKNGSRIVQDQEGVLVSGKVSTQAARTPNVDIFFVVDVSGSTAHYAGVDLGDAADLPLPDSPSGWGRPQISVFGGGFGMSGPPIRNLRNSVLAAEIAATRRFLSQLNPQTTRVGLITFSEGAKLLQPLTHDFQQVKQALDGILMAGPYGGTNMVEGIRLAIKELAGLGLSERRDDAVRVQFLLTDGFPTLPIGGGKRVTQEDTSLSVNAARISGKAGIKVHVFALGEEALSYPTAAVGIARESGGVFTPVVRPADILSVLENVSVVGVDYVEVVNLTTGQKASQLRLAADGFFSAAVPMTEGLNRIQVLARASDGVTGRDSISVYYQRGDQRSLELEVFLEKEKSLKLEVERLGRDREEIRKEVERSRENSLRRSQEPPPKSEGPPR